MNLSRRIVLTLYFAHMTGASAQNHLRESATSLTDLHRRTSSQDSSPISCGGHEAATCADCPQGNGAAWCNGDCLWMNNQCIDIVDEVGPHMIHLGLVGVTHEEFWNAHGNYAKINFLMWLITRITGSPYSQRLADELRAEEPFHDLLREQVSLRRFVPDVRV